MKNKNIYSLIQSNTQLLEKSKTYFLFSELGLILILMITRVQVLEINTHKNNVLFSSHYLTGIRKYSTFFIRGGMYWNAYNKYSSPSTSDVDTFVVAIHL